MAVLPLNSLTNPSNNTTMSSSSLRISHSLALSESCNNLCLVTAGFGSGRRGICTLSALGCISATRAWLVCFLCASGEDESRPKNHRPLFSSSLRRTIDTYSFDKNRLLGTESVNGRKCPALFLPAMPKQPQERRGECQPAVPSFGISVTALTDTLPCPAS